MSRRIRRGFARVLVVAGLCAVAASTNRVSAQTTDVQQRAELAFSEGLKLAKEQQNEAALAKFETSNATVPSARALFQIARMEKLLRQDALALQHFRQVLKQESLAEASRRESERAIEDLITKVGVISIDAPPGSTVTVDLSQVDAKGSVEVAPGLHVVKARLGADQRSVDVTCAPGKASIVRIRFDEPPATPMRSGDSQPPGAITPATDPSPLRWVVPIGLAVVGTAGVVLGGVFLANANTSVDEARRLGVGDGCVGLASPSCDRARALQDDWKTESTLSTVSFVAGGVLLVAAGATFFLWPREKRSIGTTSVSPLVSPRLAGIRASIDF